MPQKASTSAVWFKFKARDVEARFVFSKLMLKTIYNQ